MRDRTKAGRASNPDTFRRRSQAWRELIDAARGKGSHFFDQSSMRFFRSTLHDIARMKRDGWYAFVTGEQFVASDGWVGPRCYTVRFWDGETVRSAGGFRDHDTLAKAVAEMNRFVETDAFANGIRIEVER